MPLESEGRVWKGPHGMDVIARRERGSVMLDGKRISVTHMEGFLSDLVEAMVYATPPHSEEDPQLGVKTIQFEPGDM